METLIYPYAIYTIEEGRKYGIRRYNLVTRVWENLEGCYTEENSTQELVKELNNETGMILVTIE